MAAPRPAPPAPRRGRPPADLDALGPVVRAAALGLLTERGYAGTTMLAVASRARISKETLYRLHASKEALFAAIIRENAARTNAGLEASLAGRASFDEALLALGRDLLALLTGEAAVALNRAAIEARAADPTLAAILLAEGRDRTFPRIAALMAEGLRAGALAGGRPEEIAEAYLGLLLGDQPVRRILGATAAPDEAAVLARAARARDLLRRLYRPEERA